MASRPLFLATHPRACSTAFERVFMTRHDTLVCFHEPFGEAFYYGPERLSERYANDEETRVKSGHSETTYRDTMDQLLNSPHEGKRVFIKDMAQYLVPPDGKPVSIAPSFLQGKANGTTSEAGNPSVVPAELLKKFHFTFLIRHPSRAIPSYYRCTIEPLVDRTGFPNFMPNEAGYVELRQLFDYLKGRGQVGPSKAGVANGLHGDQVSITVIDADDLLEKPAEVVEAFCREVGIDYTPDMLRWEDTKNQDIAEEAFRKWEGFHDDVLNSTYLKPKEHKTTSKPSTEEENAQWAKKYGDEAQKVIRETVDKNIPHYEYLKSFALQV